MAVRGVAPAPDDGEDQVDEKALSARSKSIKRLHKISGLVNAKVQYIRKALESFRKDSGRTHGGVTSYLFSERKTIFFFALHLVATMVAWQHFAYFKFKEQEAKVPETANMYWWKRLVPALEFGAMHAILLQMALLPLTMARHSILQLSETWLCKVIPFQRMTAMHIHLGYTMAGTIASKQIDNQGQQWTLTDCRSNTKFLPCSLI